MRMNGSCAGGTGAFIDEIASVLKVPVEEFNSLAAEGKCVYDISGRCGVYAKTDIQPLLNQGISKADLALSAFHAIAKQTIGGLAQGLEIKPPVAFEGGPLTFNPVLVKVFAGRLNLSEQDILVPPHSELMIAYGAAVSAVNIPARRKDCTAEKLLQILNEKKSVITENSREEAAPLFASEEERHEFCRRHKKTEPRHAGIEKNKDISAWLGIDSGSTTTKFVLLGEDGEILDTFYAPNEGSPLAVARRALIDMRERYRKAGSRLHIIAAGTTGCGSFLENFASSLHIPVDKIADAAFSSRHPAVLGSRCTVFMNSSIITEQRNGRRAEDIMAGLCRSIIENVFTKVVRLSNVDSLGDRIVVQGGTFENDAVLRALEEYIGKEVTRTGN